MEHFAIEVGYANTRPIVPDQFTAWVLVEAESLAEAKLIAAQMVGGLCTMPTSTRLLWAEI
jgi:hypothetical protein